VGERRRFPFQFALALLLIVCVVYLARNLWLSALGNALIHNDGPARAEIAVVLAGDPWGSRLLKGADLVRQGYVPRVLVSGPPSFYGINEADAAIPFAVARGYPADWFIPLRHTAFSTRDEAGAVLGELKRRGIHSFLLVTSDYHSARARRLFLRAERERGGGPALRVVTSAGGVFDPANWWHNREGRKIVFLEWTKTLTAAFGI